MVAKISVGSSLYGAIAYNGEKINEAQGRLLTTNRIYNDGSGTVDIGKAMEGFLTFLPPQMKIEKPVVHISLNPHPEDVLTDIELQNIAREYLEKLGFGNQPYLVFKHEDIDRHHLHIVTVNVDENGKRLNRDFLYRRSDRIRRELEQKYGLHPAERKNQRLDNPLRKVAASAGDVKKQVGNTVKALNGQYRFQTMGEYRALLSLYNMTVEEARGNVRGREYHGLVYSVTDDKGNKVGNPFKSSLFGKSAGYEAVQKKFVRSKSEIKDRKLADMTKRTVLSVLQGTYDKDKFVSQLKEKGIDTVLRYTEEGRIYGATFIDHRTGCVLNGSRMGKELSANALQEHFTLPYAGQPPIPLSIPVDAVDKAHGQTAYDSEDISGGMGLLTPEGPAVDAEEEAFIRAMKRKKKKKRNWWPLKAFVLSLTLSFAVNAGSELVLEDAQLWLAIVLTLVILALGVGFDMIGTSATSCEVGPFLAMASRKVKGAKTAVKLAKNCDVVSSVCCDVVGDICGVVSGVCAATIAVTVTQANNNFWLSVLIYALISTATISLKALGKGVAVNKANTILFGVAKVLSVFSKDG